MEMAGKLMENKLFAQNWMMATRNNNAATPEQKRPNKHCRKKLWLQHKN